jgi:hypothetical protein
MNVEDIYIVQCSEREALHDLTHIWNGKINKNKKAGLRNSKMVITRERLG